MILHIEGLDLAGKSTICRLLEAKTGARRRNNTILADNPAHRQVELLRKADTLEPGGLGWLFYAVLLFDIRHYRPDDGDVIQDSTIILRSIAYHSVFGDKALAAEFRKLLPEHPRFDFSCVLVASDETRLKRLEGRCSRHNDNPEDFLIRSNPAGFHEMERILIDTAREHFGAEVIDTSWLEREGEKDRVANLILEKAHVL